MAAGQRVTDKAPAEDAESRRFMIDMLIEMRRLAGLTQTDVARRMGITQATVAGLETAAHDPKLSTMQRYARAVGAELRFELRLHDDPDETAV